jgi:hypothetical protein
VGAAATSARKGVHVSMECAAMHRNCSMRFNCLLFVNVRGIRTLNS